MAGPSQVGYAVYAVGCMVCWVPYTTVIPDLVPLPQRAAASGWQARAPGSTLSWWRVKHFRPW